MIRAAELSQRLNRIARHLDYIEEDSASSEEQVETIREASSAITELLELIDRAKAVIPESCDLLHEHIEEALANLGSHRRCACPRPSSDKERE